MAGQASPTCSKCGGVKWVYPSGRTVCRACASRAKRAVCARRREALGQQDEYPDAAMCLPWDGQFEAVQSFERVAKLLGMTKDRVILLERSAMTKLRRAIAEDAELSQMAVEAGCRVSEESNEQRVA